MTEVREYAVGEAARELGVSPQRIRQLTDSGRLPARRGAYGARLIDRQAVENLKRDRERQRKP